MSSQKKKTRVLFLKYHEDADQQPLSRKAAERLGIFPSLALGGLAAVVRNHGFPVRIIDLHAENIFPEESASRVREYSPQVIALTAKTLGWPAVVELALLARSVVPEAIIVVGGPQLSVFPRESMSWQCFDIAVLGDGEETFLDICQRVEDSGPHWTALQDIPGTLVRTSDGELLMNPARPAVDDLDRLPFTAFDLMPMHRYHCLTVLNPMATMVTSRGCPWHCGYCSQVYSERLRFRSPEAVVQEMEWLERRFGVREIVMFDETFTIGKERIRQICEEKLRRNLQVRFNIRARVDTVDRESLNLLKQAGLRSIHMGVEAGTDRLLKIMNKQITKEQAERAFKIARECGIETRGYFMIGYFDATAHDIEETIDFAKNLGLDWASFSVATALPATDLYKVCRQRGYIDGDPWKEYTLDGGGAIPQLETETFTAQQLRAFRARAYREFYLRADLIRRKLSLSQSRADLFEMLGGLGVLAEIFKANVLKKVPRVDLGTHGTV